MEELQGTSMDIVQDNIEKLKQIFPEIFTENKIDFEVLEQLLGKHIEKDNERYSFTWKGKTQARQIAQEPSTGTLRPSKEDSKNWDSTKNLYIEGDNLEVLKLLQKSYYGKIKMIYIDPPYNTGKDFVYPDNYKDNLKNYLELTGQVGEEGQKLSTNSDSNGRHHSNWLNMMYPRLKLARNLLSDDGVIFISIDDNEQDNLKKICDEIFGEENCIANIILYSNPRGRQSNKFFPTTHEHLLTYSKNLNSITINGLELNKEQLSEYSLEDERGKYREIGLRLRGGRATAEESPTLFFPLYYDEKKDIIYTEKKVDTIELIPMFSDGTLGTWRWSKDKINKQITDLKVRKVKNKKGIEKYDIFQKDYLTSEKRIKAKSLWIEKEINYDRSKDELKNINLGKFFDYAKPLYLLKKILFISSTNTKQDIILDFFSGSSTTAHAVMQLNAEDGGNRKYIMVQLPEPCDEKSEAYKAGYKNICEIGKERIRRAGEKIKEDETLLTENREKLDIGFKVFKLDTSNIKEWDSETQNLKESLFDSIDNIKSDRYSLDVLYEILLKYGLDLNVPIIEKDNFYSIGGGTLLINLEKIIGMKAIEDMCEEYKNLLEIDEDFETTVVLRDSAFVDDVDKTNAIKKLEQVGITEIKTI